MGFDTNQINASINKFFAKIQNYFQSLSKSELYAWIALGVGVVLVIISIIIW